MDYKEFEILGKYIIRVKPGTNIDIKELEEYIKENENKWNELDKEKKASD